MANTVKMGVKTDKKELILIAASTVFGERGFHSATVEAIAQQAGVGKGTIYQYFTSKAEIFKELHHWYLEKYFEGFERAINDEDSFEENLFRLITAHVDNVEAMAKVFQKILPESADLPMTKEDNAEVQAYVADKMGVLRRLLDSSIARGELRPMNKEIVLHFIIGMLAGTMHSLVGNGPIKEQDKDCLNHELVELIMRGVINPA